MASSSFQRNKHSPSSVICFFKIVLRQSLEDGNSAFQQSSSENTFKKTKYVNLRNREKQWPVTLIYYPTRKIAILSAGSVSFARENNLKAGDICIFELVYREGAELDAHIFLRDA
ncbi:hypothetical protein HN51_038209 [Arachis hypogaea]|uniref:TF-B3 domain-containing protein n=1 Tax=Arachis hypogaea TaxID=3818 RepID=A0A444ZT89_ARAHY|nr:hypothetical protein Ahy_B03g062068 [Arachis hypogaea]